MPSHTTTTVALSAVASTSLLFGYLYYHNHKSQQPRSTLKDLQGNFYATGSDVCRLYNDKIPTKVICITGTSSGLGFQTAKLLGINGAFVIMGNRNIKDDKVRQLVKDINKAGGKAITLPLDLACLASVRQFADDVKTVLKEHHLQLQVLIHNAGIAFKQGQTKDGYQQVWQVNALAPALLTELLVHQSQSDNDAATIISTKDTRVIFVSSEYHRFCFGSVLDKCPPNPNNGQYPGDYALSKACQVVLAHELTSSSTSIRGFAIEPGLVETKIGRHVPSQWIMKLEYALLGPFILRSVDQGCCSTIICALAPLKDLQNSDNEEAVYFVNCQAKAPKSNCTNIEQAKQLKVLMQKCFMDYL